MKKWACYLRVSTQEQRTDSQRQVIRDYLKHEGVPASAVKWFQDKRTGTTLERSELTKMLKAVEAGKVNTVVCYSLDRMARSLAHGVGLLQQLCERNVRVVSVTQQLDFSGIIGQTIAAVLFGLGQAEVEGRRTAIRHGLKSARDRGVTLGRPRNDQRLKQVRAMRNKGMSIADIAVKMSCSRQNIYNSLKKTQDAATEAA